MSWTIDELVRSHNVLPGDLVRWDDDDPIAAIGIVLESCKGEGYIDILWSYDDTARVNRNSTDKIMRLKPC